jgi:hypothetical protein
MAAPKQGRHLPGRVNSYPDVLLNAITGVLTVNVNTNYSVNLDELSDDVQPEDIARAIAKEVKHVVDQHLESTLAQARALKAARPKPEVVTEGEE